MAASMWSVYDVSACYYNYTIPLIPLHSSCSPLPKTPTGYIVANTLNHICKQSNPKT